MNKLELVAENTIIIEPGSRHLRIGRGTDLTPKLVPHCIARRVKSVIAKKSENRLVVHAGLAEIRSDPKLSQLDTLVTELLPIEPASGGQYPVDCPDPSCFEMNSTIAKLFDAKIDHSDDEKSYFALDDALKLNSNPHYTVHWPLKYGIFSRQSSQTFVSQDLEDIWTFALEKHFGLCRSHFQSLQVILVIDDLFFRNDVRFMVHLLLDRLRFNRILVHQSSVCATYAAGLPIACVVDIGATKTSICCVEDGISQPDTRVNLAVGTDEALVIFHQLTFPEGWTRSLQLKYPPCPRKANLEVRKFSKSGRSNVDCLMRRHCNDRQTNTSSGLLPRLKGLLRSGQMKVGGNGADTPTSPVEQRDFDLGNETDMVVLQNLFNTGERAVVKWLAEIGEVVKPEEDTNSVGQVCIKAPLSWPRAQLESASFPMSIKSIILSYLYPLTSLGACAPFSVHRSRVMFQSVGVRQPDDLFDDVLPIRRKRQANQAFSSERPAVECSAPPADEVKLEPEQVTAKENECQSRIDSLFDAIIWSIGQFTSQVQSEAQAPATAPPSTNQAPTVPSRPTSEEMRRTLLNSILFHGGGTGGLLATRFAKTLLADQLSHQASKIEFTSGQSPAQILSTNDPVSTAWSGARLLLISESASDLWITSSDWAKYGTRALRERAPFPW